MTLFTETPPGTPAAVLRPARALPALDAVTRPVPPARRGQVVDVVRAGRRTLVDSADVGPGDVVVVWPSRP